MRVIAGEFRGRRLAAPRGAVRPTADRVREALFAMLGPVEGARVLDLFAGTGALAIEALSRGAAGAVLVDRDPAPARRNVADLGLGERARVVRADALRYLARPAVAAYDLVFLDPPYRLAARVEARIDSLLPPHLAPGARVVSESAAGRPLALGLPLVRERRYGDTLIRVHRAPGGAEEPAGGCSASRPLPPG